MDPYFTSGYNPRKVPPPQDAYTFDPKIIPPEAWEQDKYWFDRKGICHKINEMGMRHLWGAMSFIHDLFPQHIDSALYNSLKASYVKAKVERSRSPVNRFHDQKRREAIHGTGN